MAINGLNRPVGHKRINDSVGLVVVLHDDDPGIGLRLLLSPGLYLVALEVAVDGGGGDWLPR